jgi:alpha-tubulin suppressor-like RCC1 family protein
VDSAVPLQVPGITDAKAIWAGGARTFVQRTDGTVWGWGANGWGALGIGTDGYVRSPMEVTR